LPLVVYSGAATFVYLAVMMLLMKNDKPTVVNSRRNRYYGDI
jgi:NADH:ubiquinone oxidoreductase subunit 6 (subunit J)